MEEAKSKDEKIRGENPDDYEIDLEEDIRIFEEEIKDVSDESNTNDENVPQGQDTGNSGVEGDTDTNLESTQKSTPGS